MTDDHSSSNVVPLSRFRARLARPRAAKRVDELLSQKDPEAAVAAMTIPALHSLITEIGLVDAVDLIALATPEQFQGCLDLEVWDRDRVQNEAILTWLSVLAETGFEKVGAVWRGLDPELTALTIRRHARVFDTTLGEEPPDESELPRIDTPDRFFIVELTSDHDEDVRMVHALIEDLYRADLALARHTLMSARSEMESHLEEMSYRWRSGRLADLGYADFYEALEVFRPLDPASVEVGEGTSESLAVGGEEAVRAPGELPVPMLEQVLGRAFLARALGAISDAAESSRLEAALIVLVNKVLAAARVSPGDEEAMVIGTHHATATLALGLEVVTRGDVERATSALQTISLTRLHRVGYTVTLGLARAARQLAARAPTLAQPSAAVLAALLRQRPFFPRVLETPPHNDIRPFESLADIAACAEHLRELATRVAVVTALGVDLVASADVADAPDLDAYGRTAVARLVMKDDIAAGALDEADLARLIGALESPPTISEMAAAIVSLVRADDVATSNSDIEVLAQGWLDELSDELGSIDADDIDSRYITAVLVQSTRD